MQVGTTVTRTVTVSNSGDADALLAVTSIALASAGDVTKTANCNTAQLGTVSGATSCTLTVTFTPRATGPVSATLTVTDNAGSSVGSTQSLTLRGTGTEPDIATDPAAGTLLDFGDARTGSSVTRTVTISNSGGLSTTLTVGGVSIEGSNTGAFTNTTACDNATLVAGSPNNSCTVTVTFTPPATGPFSGTLLILSDAGHSAGDTSATTAFGLHGTGTASSAVVTPSSHDFGRIQAGATATQVVTLTNTGAAPLTLGGDAKLVSNDSGVYSMPSNNCANGTMLDQSKPSCTVTVRFAPIGRGVYHGALQFTDDAGVQTVPFSGTGIVPDVRIDGPATQFGQVELGTTVARAITISNDGDAGSAFTISAIALDDTTEYTHSTFCDKVRLVAGDSSQNNCTFTVYFTPTTHGEHDTTLTVTDNAGDSTAPQGDQQHVSLTGYGTRPLASLDPAAGSTLDFGAVAPGATATRTVTISNTGDAPLRVSGITLTPDAGSFAQPNPNPCANKDIGVGVSCAFTVTFTPPASGTVTTTLRINDDSGAQPSAQTLTLQGAATNASATLVADNGGDFGRVQVGASATTLVTLTNTGDSDLATGDITVTGDYALPDPNPCAGLAIGAGGVCSFEVTFTPGARLPRPATLQVADDAGTQTLHLTGTGIAPHAQVAPASIAYGSTPLSQTVTRTVTITNDGDAGSSLTVYVDGGSIDDGNGNPVPAFTLGRNGCVDANGNAGSVPAGRSCSVDVRFTPTSAGAYTATLRVVDDSDGAINGLVEQDVQLSGRGGVPIASLTPTTYDFGGVLSGTVQTRVVTITNVGDPGTQLIVGQIGISPTGVFTQTNGCTHALNPSETCTITVGFAPRARTQFGATLSISSNSGGTQGTQGIPLSGRGVAPELGISPANGLDFSGVVSGTTKTLTATISNVGDPGTTLNITPTIAISPTSGGAFTQTNNCAGAALVAGGVGQTCTITATFAPKATGVQPATLRIPSNADARASTLPYRLTGAGVAPHAAVNLGSPSQALRQLDFGTAQVGTSRDAHGLHHQHRVGRALAHRDEDLAAGAERIEPRWIAERHVHYSEPDLLRPVPHEDPHNAGARPRTRLHGDAAVQAEHE